MPRVKLIENVSFHVPAYGLPIGSFNPGHVFEDITREAADALVAAGHGVELKEAAQEKPNADAEKSPRSKR